MMISIHLRELPQEIPPFPPGSPGGIPSTLGTFLRGLPGGHPLRIPWGSPNLPPFDKRLSLHKKKSLSKLSFLCVHFSLYVHHMWLVLDAAGIAQRVASAGLSRALS